MKTSRRNYNLKLIVNVSKNKYRLKYITRAINKNLNRKNKKK